MPFPRRSPFALISLGGLACLGIFCVSTLISPPTTWVLTFIGLYVVFSVYGLHVYKGTKELDFFSPIFPSTLLLFFYTIGSATRATSRGVTIYGDIIEQDVLFTYYLACLVGLWALYAGFITAHEAPPAGTATGAGEGQNPASILILKRRTGSRSPLVLSKRTWTGLLARRLPVAKTQDVLVHDFFMNDEQTFWKFLVYVPVIFLGFFPYAHESFDFVNVKAYGDIALSSRVQIMADALSPVRLFFFRDLPTMLMLSLATLLVFRKSGLLGKSAGVLIFFCYLSRALLGGHRYSLTTAGTLIFCFLHYRIRRIGILVMAVLFFAGYFMVNIMPLLRITNDPNEMAAILEESLEAEAEFLDPENSGEFLVGQNLMRLISGIRKNESHFTFGTSILSEFLIFVPRFLFPNRPLPLSERFVAVFYPGVRERGGGYGFFYLMEGYWAFGLPGVFLITFVYARVVQRTYEFFLRILKSDFGAIWFAFSLQTLVLAAVRTGILSIFKAALMNCIPFLLMFYLPDIVRPKASSHGKQ